MAKKYMGRCACGAATFEFDKDPDFVANCHCLDCKKPSGGEAATFFGVPHGDFTLLSGAPKRRHYIAESGKGLDRNFCPGVRRPPVHQQSGELSLSSSCWAAWTGPT